MAKINKELIEEQMRQNKREHTEIKKTVSEGFDKMGRSIDGFKKESSEMWEKKASKDAVRTLDNRFWGLLILILSMLIGFFVWYIKSL